MSENPTQSQSSTTSPDSGAGKGPDLGAMADTMAGLSKSVGEIMSRLERLGSAGHGSDSGVLKEVIAARDALKAERDDLAKRLKSLVDSREGDIAAAKAGVEKRHSLLAALTGAGVTRPEAALRAVEFDSAALDALETDESGALKVADLVAKITAAVPELVKPQPAPGQPAPQTRPVVPPTVAGVKETRPESAFERFVRTQKG